MRKYLLFWSVFLFFLGSVGVKGQNLFGEQQVISTNVNHPQSIYVVDLDEDGDMDVISASSWYENDGNGDFSIENSLPVNGENVLSIYIADLDGDEYMDVISTFTKDNDKVVWYKNDGNGNFSEEISISINGVVGAIYPIDLDKDGDIDIISASSYSDKIVWHENDGGGDFSEKNIISSNDGVSDFVYSSDLDKDGNIDVFSDGFQNNRLFWYRNNGNDSFVKQEIITIETKRYFASVCVADLDGDGSMDVISALDDRIIWYKNDSNGNFNTGTLISANIDGVRFIYAEDLDKDGDVDVLFISQNDNKIAWYENDGNGNFSNEILIDLTTSRISSAYLADLDKDGDIDVFAAFGEDNKITWYENLFKDTSIDNLTSNNKIKVFPNPFSDYTTIEVNGLSQNGNYRLEVRDILGRTVRELRMDGEELILNRGGLESGLYFMRVLEEGDLSVIGAEKIIVR